MSINMRQLSSRRFIPRQDPIFQGRAEQLKLIQQAFSDGPQSANICVLSGLAGIGKTQIALEYVYQQRDAYASILLADASDPASLETTFKWFAGAMGIPYYRRRKSRSLLREIHRWMQRSTNWLIVFDGAKPETLCRNVHEEEDISRFWPTNHSGKILITTRVRTDWYYRFDVPALQEGEAVDLLVRCAGHVDEACTPNASRGSLRPIVADLAGIPLAIDQVGAWMSEHSWSFPSLLEDYTSTRCLILATRGRLSGEHPESILEALSREVHWMEREYPEAASLLKFCCQLAPIPIPEGLIQYGLAVVLPLLQGTARGGFYIDQIFIPLLRQSLISRQAWEKTFTIHPLVALSVEVTLSSRERSHWARLAAQALDLAMNYALEQGFHHHLLPHMSWRMSM